MVAKALEIALSQVGQKEVGKNAGPAVEKYLKSVGLGPGYPWCMAFVYWSVQQACILMEESNPLVKTGGVLRQWNERPTLRAKTPQPGDIFIMDYGRGQGHTGFVVSVDGEMVETVEGNTNSGGSREGDGVYRRRRKISGMKGFLRLSADTLRTGS